MLRFIISRLIGLVGVLLAVSMITFLLMHAVPGGPFDAQAMQRQQMIPEAIKQQLNAKFGLDKPIWQQYLVFLGNAVRLDFGYSFSNSTRTVVQIFQQQWPYTIQLGVLTLAFSTIVGLGLGVGAAIKQGSWLDYTGTFVSVFCLVMPSFVFAVLLQFVFSVRLAMAADRRLGQSEAMDHAGAGKFAGANPDLAALYTCEHGGCDPRELCPYSACQRYE